MNNHVNILPELCSQYGIEHAVICPGSRSAPLVFAFNRHKNIKTYVIIDERSAAYIALGMAQQLQKPVVLICTSGTAALNFYPAIAEAYYQKIPLIVLTADRPSELLNQQDGQMINQVNVFGSHVRGNCEFEFQISNFEIRNLLEKSMYPVMGPVHINVPLVEPLYNEISIGNQQLANSNYTIEKKVDTSKLNNIIKESSKKIILIGQLLPNRNLNKILYDLQQKGFVILADVVSNQHGNLTIKQFDFIITQATTETLKELAPDLIISFGGPVLSKALKIWLKKQKPKYHFRIQQDETLVDTYNNVTDYLFSSNISVLDSINNFKFSEDNSFKGIWNKLGKKSKVLSQQFVANNTSPFNELVAVNSVLQNLPENSQLQIANSTSIRYISYLGLPDKNISVFCNRGTSGIDGCSSTAVGLAMMTNEIVTFITGDLAFFYDRNAFWNNYVSNNLRVILLNNNGGGIFNLIDGPNSMPELEQFFLTKHHLKAKNLADDFGLIYENCNTQNDLNKTLEKFYKPSEKAKILELNFDMNKSAEVYKRFKKIILE